MLVILTKGVYFITILSPVFEQRLYKKVLSNYRVFVLFGQKKTDRKIDFKILLKFVEG